MPRVSLSVKDALLAIKRQRRALLVVDVVESVRLMEHDEDGTVRRWLRFVAFVRDELLPLFNGRLVKSLGDGLLLEFEAVPPAVAAALSMQAAAKGDASGTPLTLRIGLHVADVIVDDLDIYGNGVNLASRLTTLAGPGEVVASADVRELLSDGIGARVEDLGECFLKHVERPVRAFRLSEVGALPTESGQRPEIRPLGVTIAVVPPIVQQPSDGASWALGDAVADAINVCLARCPELRVVSRLSTGALRDTDNLPDAARRHLNAVFVVSGSCRLSGDRISLQMELCDTRNHCIVWAGGVEIALAHLFTGEDVQLQALVREVASAVSSSESMRARGLPLPTLETFSLYVGGVALLHRLRQTDFVLSRQVLEALHEREPRHAAPVALLGMWHLFRVLQGWAQDRTTQGRLAHAWTRRALDVEPEHTVALAIDAMLCSHFDGDLPRARELASRAIASDPQETLGWMAMAGIESYEGHATAAIDCAKRCIEQSPLDPKRFIFELLLAAGQLAGGKAEEAVETARASLRLNALHAPSHRLHVIALTLAGRAAEAHMAVAQLLRLDPSFNVRTFEARYPGREHSHAALYVQALRDAGVPR
jgi:adenylate cyclase